MSPYAEAIERFEPETDTTCMFSSKLGDYVLLQDVIEVIKNTNV
jgi:hypothetical protein